MPDTRPRLSHKDVEAELDAIYAKRRSAGRESPRHLFAFYGEGDEARLTCATAGTFDVIPVRSELELRERMPKVDDRDRRIAFLVPFTRDVPIDLAGRFHRHGKVIRIGPDAQIGRLFGVGAIDDAVRASALVQMLLATGATEPLPARSAVLDVDHMWAAWLSRAWGLETSGGSIGLEALLAWAAEDGRGSTFLADVPEALRAEVEGELTNHLVRRLGPAGAAVFGCWQLGRGRDALELALICDPLAPREDVVVRFFVRERMRGLPGIDGAAALDAARALGAAAGGALRLLESRAPESTIRALLRDADRRVEQPEIRPFLENDVRLPIGWSARLERLAAALTDGARAPSADAVARAASALRALESHRSFGEPESLELVRRAEMAVRLLGWLAERGDRRIPAPDTSLGDLEVLGRWYAEEGGFVDWARHAARGPQIDALGRAVSAVLAAADDARLELDRRFARSLKSYVDARRQSSMVLPLDRVSERLAARFLAEREERRLLVLLVDGMAWAQAAELMLDLEDHHVGPIAWNWSKKGRVGDGTGAIHNVVLAGLPTITEVSRSGFFEGAPIPPGKNNDANADDERFRRNKALLAFFAGSETPTLLLRAEVSADAGYASEAARRAVADRETRVVGVVLNAIDSSLKGDPQTGIRWTASTIRPLLPLLDAAREAGRAVLLVSDHGHVPSDCFGRGVRAAEGGARWRAWKGPDDPVADWELVFQGEGVWVPRGAQGVALITDDRHRYGGSVHAGEHGGATLAEVVVPCLFLGFDQPASALDDDRDLRVRGFHTPSFWRFEVRESAAATEPEHARGQLPLLAEVPPPSSATPAAQPQKTRGRPPHGPAPETELHPLAVALRSSELLRTTTTAARVDRVLRAVSLLATRDGRASEQVFAAELGEPVRRVGQLVSVLSESLNVDSFPVLVHERRSKEVRLDRELLVQQFGLPKESAR